AEEPDVGEKERENADLIVIGKVDLIVAHNWVRPIRVGNVPKRAATVDRWQGKKVFMRRRGRGCPFQRPRVPGIIARYFSAEERLRDVPNHDERSGAHEKHPDGRNHVHPTPVRYIRVSKDATGHAIK